jgi:hypothetical protein
MNTYKEEVIINLNSVTMLRKFEEKGFDQWVLTIGMEEIYLSDADGKELARKLLKQ